MPATSGIWSSFGPGPAGRAGPRPLVRILFIGLMVGWLTFPFLQIGTLAEDAIPFVAAGRVDATVPGSLYGGGDRKEVTDAIRDASCPLKPVGTCETYEFPYLGPPQVVVLMKAVNVLGDEPSLVFMRMLSAAAFVAGFGVLWRRLAADDGGAQLALLVAAALLTPFAYTSAAFGQNAPLMFLSAALGLSRTGRNGGALAAATTFVASALFKLFPIPLLALAAFRRRWRFLAWSVGLVVVLTVITAAVVPTFQYGEFMSSSRALTATRVASPWNVSVDGLVYFFDHAWRGQGAAFYAAFLVRLAIVVGLFWWRLRDADEDLQWSYAWAALLVLHPQIWWHYFAVVVPATAYAVRARGRRDWWPVAAAALVVAPLAIVTDETTLQFYSVLVAVVATVGLPFFASPTRGRREVAVPA